METQIDDNTFLCVDVTLGDTVWVKSETFRAECSGYVHGLAPPLASAGECLLVRMDLPDDNPSLREAVADSGLPWDQVELVDVVPLSAAEHPDGRPVRSWRRDITAAERAARARRRGFDRPALPELDAGLRCQR